MKLLATLIFLLGFNPARAQKPFFPQFGFETGKWSFIDLSGNEVLKISLSGISDLHPFSDGLAAAQDSATLRWGFINQSGKWEIKPAYEQVQDFVDGYAIISHECKTNCNQNQEGLLNNYISDIIDKKGKIVFTDNSQHENPSERFFLDENIGAGLFRVTMGYGFNDMKNVINLKGYFLCDTYSVFGNGGNIIYDRELKAYKCFNKFYKPNGELVLDLSRYYFTYPFSEGYAWVNLEEALTEDDVITWNILVDAKGKEILKLANSEYSFPEAVENGGFLYVNANGEILRYNLADQKSALHQPSEIESDTSIELGEKQPNGSRFFYTAEDNSQLIGFINADGNVFYKISL